MLRRTIRRRDPPSLYATRPAARPIASAARCGSRQISRNSATPIQTGQ